MFLTGQGWEGEVTFLRKVPEHAHKAKMVDNRCVFLHLGQGEGMSARALNKGVSMHMAHTHIHTHIFTQTYTHSYKHTRAHTHIHTGGEKNDNPLSYGVFKVSVPQVCKPNSIGFIA